MSGKEETSKVAKPLAHLKSKPTLPPQKGIPIYGEGRTRSIAALKALGFDPITALVERYKAVHEEVEFWKKIRSGEIVVVRDGKPDLRYSPEAHSAAEAMLISIGEKLIRYKYGRVPEIDNSDRRPTPLIIDLGNREGTLTIGRDPITYDDNED